MTQQIITKAQLAKVLNDWGSGRLTSEQLQDWMIDQYDPTEVDIGPGESELVQEAMNVIMNEYEIGKIETFVVENYALALAFLSCNDNNFLDKRTQFLRKAFTD